MPNDAQGFIYCPKGCHENRLSTDLAPEILYSIYLILRQIAKVTETAIYYLPCTNVLEILGDSNHQVFKA